MTDASGKSVSDATILVLWKGGQNTHEISRTLGVPEHEIERRLHLAKPVKPSIERSSTNEVAR